MNIDELNKDELERLQVDKEGEFQLATMALTTAELKENELSVKVAELQLEKRRLNDAIIKGKSNVRTITSELRAIKTMIYRVLAGL